MLNFFRRKKDGKQTGKRGRDEGFLFAEYGNSEVFRKSLIILLTASIVFLAVFILMKTYPVFLLLFAGVLFAVTIASWSGSLKAATGLSYRASISMTLAILAVSSVLVILFVVPQASGEFRLLPELLAEAMTSVSSWLRDVPGGEFLRAVVDALTGPNPRGTSLSRFAGVFSSAAGTVSAVFLIVLIGAYLAVDPAKYVAGVLSLVPPGYRKRAGDIMKRIGSRLRSWLTTSLFSAAFRAVTVWVTLALLGVPLAFALALLGGFSAFVPYFGSLFAAAPILLTAFRESPATALFTLAAYSGVLFLEGGILLPLVRRNEKNVPPVLTILMQLLSGILFGLPGVLLAAPLATAAAITVEMLYVEDVLEGRPPPRDET